MISGRDMPSNTCESAISAKLEDGMDAITDHAHTHPKLSLMKIRANLVV